MFHSFFQIDIKLKVVSVDMAKVVKMKFILYMVANRRKWCS